MNVLILGSCLFSLLTVSGFTQSPVNKLIMVTEEWPPYRMNDPISPSGFSGIDIDLTLALEKELGIPIEIQRHPWARALAMMDAGQADLITGIARTPEREAYMAYIFPSYSAVRPVFYAPKGRGSEIQTYNDLYGKTIGMSTHSAYFEPFNSDIRLNKVNLSTEIQILNMLALQRIELAIGTDPNMSYDVARLNHGDKVEPTAYQPETNTPLYIALSRNSLAMSMYSQIERALQTLLENQTIEEILSKYR